MSFLCFQKIAIQTFRENFCFDQYSRAAAKLFDEAYTLSALKLELADKESETYFILMSGKSSGIFESELGKLSNRAGIRRCI